MPRSKREQVNEKAPEAPNRGADPEVEASMEENSLDCPTCGGSGLVGTNFEVAGKHEVCVCGGTGKKVA